MHGDPKESHTLIGSNKLPCGAPIDQGALASDLKDVMSGAAKGAAQGGDAKMDKGEIAKLCALGYMSGPACDGL